MYLSSASIRLLDRGLRWLSRLPGFRRTAKELDRLLVRDVAISLQCGVKVRGDLRRSEWRRMAGRGYHELDTEQFLVEYLRSGDVVVDVGAHIGMLTAVAAQLLGPSGVVYAFEVDPTNFLQLVKTIRRNSMNNVYPQNIALSDVVGTSQFYRPEDSWGAFMINPRDCGLLSASESSTKTGIIELPTTTLDTFFQEHAVERLDLIKIDVDGPELAILRGGTHIIRGYKPALIVETSYFNRKHSTFDETWTFLRDSGYEVYAAVRASKRVQRIHNPQDLPADISRSDSPSVNLYCRFPEVHANRWQTLWFMKQ